MEIKSVIVWGDSILKGIVSTPDFTQIRPIEDNALKIAGDALGLEIINKSIYGATSAKIRQTQIKNLHKNLTADIGLIECGTNDSDYEWSNITVDPNAPHTQKVPLEDFIKNINELVDDARENKITPVLVVATKLVKDWWFDYICRGQDKNAILNFIDGEPQLLIDNQAKYYDALKKIAAEKNVQLIDIFTEFEKLSDTKNFMCKDGVHPNADGHKFMAELFKNELPKLKKEF